MKPERSPRSSRCCSHAERSGIVALWCATRTAFPGAAAWAIFLLSFFGFGVKAGLLPVNSWLPRAHPIAPGNVSALLSGVILNLGVYGIVLVNLQLVPVRFVSEGVIVLIVGAASALIGILYATIEDDLKTMLAYSSVENLGIAVTAFGVAFVFTAERQALFAAIGFAAGIYHVANHSAYKGLLFLGAATRRCQARRTIDESAGWRDPRAASYGGALLHWRARDRGNPAAQRLRERMDDLSGLAAQRRAVVAWAARRFRAVRSGARAHGGARRHVLCKGVRHDVLGPAAHADADGRRGGQHDEAWDGAARARVHAAGRSPDVRLAGNRPGRGRSFRAQTVTRALVPPFFKPTAGPDPLPADFVATFHALGAQIGMGVPGRGWVVMLRGGSANPVVFAMSTTYLLLIIALIARHSLWRRSFHHSQSPGRAIAGVGRGSKPSCCPK